MDPRLPCHDGFLPNTRLPVNTYLLKSDPLSEVRAYEDLEGKLGDMIEMPRKRVPHGDILDYLKVKDRKPLL